MATSGRGGYRKPQGARPASGPGKYSQRTDANDPPRTPNVSDSELQYGDRQRLEQGQNIAPRASGSAPTRSGSPARPSPRGGRSGAGILPDFLFSESNREGEPVTTGLDIGTGDGSEVLNTPVEPQDDREAVLQFLASRGNMKAEQLLAAKRQAMMAEMMPAAPMPPMAAPPVEEPTEPEVPEVI